MSKKKRTEDTALSFEAVLTEEEMYRGEEKGKEWGVIRRIMLATLRGSSRQLTEAIDSDEAAETMLNCAEDIRKYIEHREDEIKLCKSAEARILFVLKAYIESRPEVMGAPPPAT